MDTLASRLPLDVNAVYIFWMTYDSIWQWMEAARALLEKDSFIAVLYSPVNDVLWLIELVATRGIGSLLHDRPESWLLPRFAT